MQNTTSNKFIYRSSPIFNEDDKELIEKWKNYSFTTMIIFCKFYRNEDGRQGIGYVIMYEDGWEYGSFYAHLKNLDFKEASAKALYEMLLHASELKPKKVVILTENKKLLEQMTDDIVKKRKDIAGLLGAFSKVDILLTNKDKIENFERLRESAFSNARSGSKDTSRTKHRFRVTMLASNEEISKEESDRRMKELASLLVDMYWKYEARPANEKITEAESDLKELENNQDEEPDFAVKREELLKKIQDLKQKMTTSHQDKDLLGQMPALRGRVENTPYYDVGL